MKTAMLSLDALNRSLPTTRTTDAVVARRCLGRVFAQHSLEVRGSRLDFMHQHMDLAESSISLLRYGSEVEIVAPPLDFYLLQITLSGRTVLRAEGLEATLEAGSAFVMNPGTGYRKLWDREAQQLILKIPRFRLDARTLGAAKAERASAVEFASAPLPAGALAEPVRRLLDQLGVDNRNSDRCRKSPGIRASESDLVDAILAALPHRIVAHRKSVEAYAVPYYIWRAERHLRANSGSSVKMGALAQLAGVSERTLQEGFQRFRGKPPSHVSRDGRLDFARAALVGQGAGNVTGVALEFGFTHLGRFAQIYAERFGEYPSETLRRRRTKQGAE